MSNIAIKVENLGKLYRLGEVGTGTLSHDLNRWFARVRGKEDPFSIIGDNNNRNGNGDYVWALKDVDFEVKQGEVLGIIGKNGAGKSTLLKLLSKVTKPTKGRMLVKGRIASLLEVGTGFHPEMTGRENIFLNGAILGMTKKEIKTKFDEMIDFAGVERYVDTPVKRYSSGMYVRLAFAVAAFLEPEILIVDEVLAVGDAEFQKKCLGRMKDVSVNDGRTVLFVSHNMAAVKSLCTEGVLLQQGTLIKSGSVSDIVAAYLLSGSSSINHKKFTDGELRYEDVVLEEFRINSSGKSTGEPIVEGEEVELFTCLNVGNGSSVHYHITFHLYNEIGEVMFSFSPTGDNMQLKDGRNELICRFPCYFFNTGTFYLTFLLVKDKKNVVLMERDIISFTVVNGQAPLGTWMGREPGFLKPRFIWEHKV